MADSVHFDLLAPSLLRFVVAPRLRRVGERRHQEGSAKASKKHRVSMCSKRLLKEPARCQYVASAQAGSVQSYPGYRQFAGRDQGAPCGQHHVVLGFLPGQPAQPPACQGTMGQAGTRARKVCCLGSFCAVCASRFHACMQTVARRACASDATANRTRTTIVVSLMWSTLAKDSVVTASGSMSRDSANLESICPSSTIP